MKKLSYLLILLLGLFLTGCDSDDDDEILAFSILKSEVCFSAKGGEGTIEVAAPEAFKASSNTDWCTLSVSGNQIKVNVTPNPEYLSRTALVKVSYSGQTLSVPVTQEGVLLRPTQEQVSFGKNGGTQKILFPGLPEGWTATVKHNWCSLQQKADTLMITTNGNNGDEILSDTITVSFGNTSIQIPVMQANKSLNDYFTTSTTPWYFDPAKTTGDYTLIFTMISSELENVNPPEILKSTYLSAKATDEGTHALNFITFDGTTALLNSLTYNFISVAGTDNEVEFTFTQGAYGQYCVWYYNNISGIQYLTFYLNSTFILTADHPVTPTEITFTDQEDPSLSFTLSIGNS